MYEVGNMNKNFREEVTISFQEREGLFLVLRVNSEDRKGNRNEFQVLSRE